MSSKTATRSRLAIDGGLPIRTAPLPPWPAFGEEHVAAVAEVLRSGKVNYWTGPHGRLFEQEFAEYCGSKYAVALANGTVALELALAAGGIGPGDEVLVTSRSFVASASCCLVRGATPVFADVDADSQNVTAETLRPCLTPRTKAIIAVHLAGWPCEMDPIMELARQHGLLVIEDCAQAHGARYKGRMVGALGHVAAFSFCQDKILTTGGEGGMLTTNDERIWNRAWSLKDHGKSYQAAHRNHAAATFRWLHESIGTNGRMTEMQAALGRVMLRQLPQWLALRRKHAAFLSERFRGLPALRVAEPPSHVEHSYYKYYVFLKPECLRPPWSRDRIVTALQAEGIPCGTGICPEIYRERAFDQPGLRPQQRRPVAARLGETSLMFPVHPTLSECDLEDMGRAMEKVLCAAVDEQPAAVSRAA